MWINKVTIDGCMVVHHVLEDGKEYKFHTMAGHEGDILDGIKKALGFMKMRKTVKWVRLCLK